MREMRLLVPDDPRLQQLREDLAEARRRGEPFSVAWVRAKRRALAGLPHTQRVADHAVLAWARDVFRDAYDGAPPSPRERAISELESFAVDGELQRLHA